VRGRRRLAFVGALEERGERELLVRVEGFEVCGGEETERRGSGGSGHETFLNWELLNADCGLTGEVSIRVGGELVEAGADFAWGLKVRGCRL